MLAMLAPINGGPLFTPINWLYGNRVSVQINQSKGASKLCSRLVGLLYGCIIEPENDAARQLLADTYEQLGYQAEGAGWRNIYLTGAQELRVGIQAGAPKTASADVISEMDMPTLFDFLAVKIDSLKAAKHGLIKMNVITPDTKDILYIELSNGNLSNAVVDKEQAADANLIVNKADVNRILLGQVTLKELLANGDAKLTGDKSAFGKIAESMVEFNPAFEIVPTPVH